MSGHRPPREPGSGPPPGGEGAQAGGASSAGELRVVFPRRGAAVVEFSGEHDLGGRDSTGELLAQLVRTNKLVVVDLSEAAFIDSSVLMALVSAHRLAQAEGRSLRVQIGAGTHMRTLFEAAGVLDYLDCVTDREEALSTVAPPRAPS